MSATAVSSTDQSAQHGRPEAGPNLIMSRKPIYDAKFAPLGYEMRLHGEPGRLAHRNSFFFDAFTSMPPEQLLGGALAFIHCESDEIVPDFEEIVDPKRIVVDLAAPKGSQSAGILAENVDSLNARGFRVSVGEYALQGEYRTLLNKVNYLKIDTRRIEPLILQVLPRRLARIQPLKLIAAHLPSPEVLETMVSADYHGFHGTLHSQKISSKVKTIDSSRQSILLLMRQVQQEGDINTIEAGLKRDPGLSFNLMRYVNSAAFIQYSKTTTLKRAAQLLGNQKLYRWLSMRLMASSNHPAQGLLLRAALTRGRMMELLATECTPRLSPEDAFLTGVFSLLDRLLGMDIETALAGIELKAEVKDGLAHGGPLGKLLISVEACELPDEEVLLTYEHELGIAGLLPMAHLHAIQWAEEIINI
jgi:EAL and modified HD-GYP domain-containing signal transduction protein